MTVAAGLLFWTEINVDIKVLNIFNTRFWDYLKGDSDDATFDFDGTYEYGTYIHTVPHIFYEHKERTFSNSLWSSWRADNPLLNVLTCQPSGPIRCYSWWYRKTSLEQRRNSSRSWWIWYLMSKLDTSFKIQGNIPVLLPLQVQTQWSSWPTAFGQRLSLRRLITRRQICPSRWRSKDGNLPNDLPLWWFVPSEWPQRPCFTEVALPKKCPTKRPKKGLE